ncbi:hypothetical protein B484DRAFT_432199 [Ochromonadaceae sp. CCMP2298]|nr:hypothetical protein B484DRAFT_432199 [Ochromonadaceae sp. CCMP2298]
MADFEITPRQAPTTERLLRDYAQFYPTLVGMTRGHIVHPEGQMGVLFTNNYGTAGYDLRHFIDYNTMRSLPHGAALETSIIAPQPLCRRIVGKEMERQSIVGMLGVPLEVKVKLNDKMILLRLEQVLVIDRLPVPLHISIQRLGAFNDLDELTKAMQNRKHPIHVAFNKPSHNRSIYEPPDLSAPPPPEELPEEFHDHPYWTSDTIYLGNADEAHGALQQHIISEAQQTGPAVQRVL